MTSTSSRMPSLAWMLEWNRVRRPRKVAVREATGVELDYQRLSSRVRELADRMQHAQVRPGAVVAVLVEGSADHLAALFAASAVTAVAVPLDPFHADEQLRARSVAAGATAVLTDAANQQRLDLPVVPVGAWRLDRSAEHGLPIAVTPTSLEAVQRLVRRRDGDPGPVTIRNGAALWAQAAAIRELDLREHSEVGHASLAELIASTDELVLPALAAGATVTWREPGASVDQIVAWLAGDGIVGVLATRPGSTWVLAADLDSRRGAGGDLQVRGPRSVLGDAWQWVPISVPEGCPDIHLT